MAITRKNKATAIADIIQKSTGVLSKIMAKANSLKEINDKFHAIINDEVWQNNTVIVDFSETTITLLVPNAAVATYIKMQTFDIIKQLQASVAFHQVRKIICQVSIK